MDSILSTALYGVGSAAGACPSGKCEITQSCLMSFKKNNRLFFVLKVLKMTFKHILSTFKTKTDGYFFLSSLSMIKRFHVFLMSSYEVQIGNPYTRCETMCHPLEHCS